MYFPNDFSVTVLAAPGTQQDCQCQSKLTSSSPSPCKAVQLCEMICAHTLACVHPTRLESTVLAYGAS